MTNRKYKVGLVGGTGMVGQRFATLLADHPWFEVTVIAASPRSAGMTYAKACEGRWALEQPMPKTLEALIVKDAGNIAEIAPLVDFVFCAVDLPKDQTKQLEESYAKAEIPVVSNNSAHRMTSDVPVMIPEVNPEHAEIIHAQRKRLGTKFGFIAAKPNCSLQSYQPALHPLREFGIEKIIVSTYQAISGAGKTFESWPEMLDNVIPFIQGEEEKSEQEPLKIWGEIAGDKIISASGPGISAHCIRVPVSDGHLATVSVLFSKNVTEQQILEKWKNYRSGIADLNLPSAPKPFLHYFEESNRPQTGLDRMFGNGMGVSIGRLRRCPMTSYKFVSLSHNTLRGAAGGAVLTAELLCAKGFITKK